MKPTQTNELVFTTPAHSSSEARIESHALITRPSRRRCQPWAALAVWMGFIVSLRGDAIIDFSNHVEGVLDAPVYDVDGVTRLQGSQFFAELLLSVSGPGSLAPVGFVVPFQTGTNAGYWLPQPITIRGATAGQRVWVLVRAWEPQPALAFGEPPVPLLGWSKVFSVVLQDSPTPLMGLESFRLAPPDFRVERQSGNFIVRWSGHRNIIYSLETTTDLTAAGSWNELWWARSLGGSTMSVTNAISSEQRFFRLKMWR